LYRPGQLGYDGLDPAGGYVYYLKVLGWGLGWPILVFASAGLLLALARRDRPLLVVASFPVALYAVKGYERMYFARFILPALPALLVLAAVAVVSLVEWLARRLGPARGRAPACAAGRVAGPALLLAALVLGAPPLLASARFDAILTREDTRTQAAHWIGANLPAGARVVVDW